MPLHKSLEINSFTSLKLWKIEESFADLFNAFKLSDASVSRVKNMKSELHARGFLSVRFLLNEFGYTDFDLYYDDCGKPHLKDGNYISITHSFTYAAVIIGSNPVGIDVEKQREKIKNIAHKFTDYETLYLNSNPIDIVKKLTIIWCIKETLFKVFATQGLSFKSHILVLPFLIQDEETVAWINFNQNKIKYKVHFFEFDNFTCAYTFLDN